MFERFSKEARATVVGAQEEARSLRHGWIGTEHLLLAALRHPDQPGAATLVRLGVTGESCRAAVAGVVTARNGTLGDEDAAALRSLGIDLDAVRRSAEQTFGEGALDEPQTDPGGEAKGGGVLGTLGHIPFTRRAKKALELSLRESAARKARRIGVEHVVLGLLRADDPISRAVLDRLGLVPKDVRALVLADLKQAA